MKTFFLSAADIDKIFENLSQKATVYVPKNVEGNWVYRKWSPENTFEFNNTCAIQPAKSFMFVPRELVAKYPSDDPDKFITAPPIVIVGMKPCDVRSLEVLDSQFLTGDFVDPFYQERRKTATIITTECYNPEDTCFCNMLGIEPFPTEEYGEKGIDLNISPAEGGYLVDILSEKGEKIIEENKNLFMEPSSVMLSARDEKRKELQDKLEEINKDYKISQTRKELLREELTSDKWWKAVEPCVECGACLLVCPTCHCFLLYDRKRGDTNERIKVWDGCIYSGYARMAGGGTPRPLHMERFRHRFLHKFDYFVDNYNIEACTGCGRCIRGCMGNIDIRKVFKLMDVKGKIPVNR